MPESTSNNDLCDAERQGQQLFFSVFFSLAAVTLISKAVHLLIAFFQVEGSHAALSLLYHSPLIRLLGIGAGAFLFAKAFARKWKWLIALATVSVYVLLKAAPLIAECRWVGPLVFGTFHEDLLFLCGALLFIYALVSFSPQRWRKTLAIFLYTILGLMFLISGLEMAHFTKTGLTGSGHLLAYFLANATDMWFVLRTQIDFISVLALLGPPSIGLISWWLLQRRGKTMRVAAPYRVVVPVALLSALLLGAASKPVLSDHRYDRFVSNTYLDLADLLPWGNAERLKVVQQAQRQPLLYDSTSAYLEKRGSGSSPARNVIVVMLESTRASATTVYNPSLQTTPFLLNFSSRGAVVPDMYAVIPKTADAWIAVLYGAYPSTNDLMTQWPVDKNAQTRQRALPGLLKQQGYTSAFFTPTRLDYENDDLLLQQMGFDLVVSANNLTPGGFERANYFGFEDRIMVGPALAWAKKQQSTQHPFLMVLMTNVGHHEYTFPSSWKRKSYTDPGPYNDYLNCLAYVDTVLKDLFDGLDAAGILRSSIVVVLGDHGESFGEHIARQHLGVVYEEGLKIPMVVVAPGLVQPGIRISGLRQQIDVLPTVVDLLNMQMSGATYPGTSLFQPVPQDRKLFFSGSFDSTYLALRRDNLKFIYKFGRTPTEVYNIARDPQERRDIALSLPPAVVETADENMQVWSERVRNSLRAKLR